MTSMSYPKPKPGQCGRAEEIGDCEQGLQGSWPLSRADAKSFATARDACLMLCRGCGQCNHVSFSNQWKDCSWFNACPQLQHDVKHFHTVTVETAQVARVVNEAVSRGPRARRIMRVHDDWANDWARNATAALLQLGLTPARVADSPLLRHRLRKCAHRDASGDQTELKLLVLGASMALGNFNCGRNVACVGDRQGPQRAWPSLLQAMLREALPACNARVKLHAYGGWTSETAAMRLEKILMKSQVWDVILLDASVNDADISNWGRAEQRREYMTSAAESMVQTGARRAIPVVLIDTVARWVQPLRCVSASRMLSASVYARLAEHHQLPHIDLQGASCGDREAGEVRHWRAGCEAVDAPGATGSCWMHPGPSTHVALAALLVHAFAAIAVAGEERLLPERPPRVGTLQPAFEVASFEICRHDTEKTDLGFGCDLTNMPCTDKTFTMKSFAPSTVQPGWAAFMDRPGKPGCAPHRGSNRRGRGQHQTASMRRSRLWAPPRRRDRQRIGDAGSAHLLQRAGLNP